jgi:hypothetical protein
VQGSLGLTAYSRGLGCRSCGAILGCLAVSLALTEGFCRTNGRKGEALKSAKERCALRLWKQPNQWYELSSANSSSPTAARLQRNGPPLLSSQLRLEGGPDLVHLAGSRRREVLSTVPSCDQAPALLAPPQMAAPPCQSAAAARTAHHIFIPPVSALEAP